MSAVRAAVALLALAVAAGGCAELGVVTDGTSISYGRPSRGRLIDGVKLPDKGPGFVVPATWSTRGNRYGTNELVSLIKGVSKRMRKKSRDARLVVADLSANNGGESRKWHKSHQTGRDVDLLFYVRDAQGKAIEPDVMHTFDGKLTTRDGTGITIDVPRTWALVRELLTAQEAYVQYIFIYRPIGDALIDYATKQKEPDAILERARLALKQPGDSAPHNDHMHVRVFCAPTDRMFGCVDIGPLEMLALREAEAQQTVEAIARALPPSESEDVVADADEAPVIEKSAADVWKEAAEKSSQSTSVASTSAGASIIPPSFTTLMRTSAHRVDLRSWR